MLKPVVRQGLGRQARWITLGGWGIVAIAVLIRLVQYAGNRSLWADEAVLALNLVDRNFGQLAQPLDYDQGAPLLYLWATKLCLVLLGNTEYALRLVPLLGGLLGLGLFYGLARQFLAPGLAVLALGWFSSLRYLVYYATELKQYSTDITLAIACFGLVLMLGREGVSRWRSLSLSLGLTLGGAIAIWASHPAVFVLMGTGAMRLGQLWQRLGQPLGQPLGQQRGLGEPLPAETPPAETLPAEPQLREQQVVPREVMPLLGSLAVWGLSFLGCYWLTLRSLTGDPELMGSWNAAFPSHPLDLIWVLDALGKFFHKPLGFLGPLDGVAIALFLLGCMSYAKRQPQQLALLLSPLGATLVASVLQKYPFRGRLVIFLAPFMLIVMAEGAGYLWRLCKPWWTQAIALGLCTWMVVQPVVPALALLGTPPQRQEIRPVLRYIIQHQQPEDQVYVFQRGKYQFLYYAGRPGYRPSQYILGVEDLDEQDGKALSEQEKIRYRADLDQLKGRDRVWVLFSHVVVGSERRFIEDYLNQIGRKIGEYHQPGAFVYLYDLS